MQETATPSPWKTLRGFALRGFCALIFAVVLWSLWYAYAAYRLNAKLAEYRSRGELSSPQDLVGETLSPENNGYLLLIKAGDSLHLSADEREFVDSPTSPNPLMLPLSEAQMAIAQQMIVAHADVLRLVAQAATAPGITCPTDLYNLAKSADFSHLGKFRAVCNFVRAILFFHHQAGRDDLVASDIQSLEMIARATANGHYLIHGLVAMAISNVTSDALLQIVPDLQLSTPSDFHGMPRDVANRMSEEFLDSGPLLEIFRKSIEAERLYQMSFAEAVDRHTFLLMPMFRLDGIRASDARDDMLVALGTTSQSYASFQSSRFLSPSVSSETNLYIASHLVTKDDNGFQRLGLVYFRYVSNRRAAGLGIAIRMYRVDQAGKFPPTLKALRPLYLKELPIDLFALTSQTFIYSPERQIFYSVGTNGMDDGGIVSSGTRLPDWYHALDAVYPLTRTAILTTTTSSP